MTDKKRRQDPKHAALRSLEQAPIKLDAETVADDDALGRDADDVLRRAAATLPQLMEHPIQTWKPEERAALEGRKVYYRDQPAIVKRGIWDQGCVIVEAEQGRFRPLPGLPADLDEDRETTKVDILSPHIWWWRDA